MDNLLTINHDIMDTCSLTNLGNTCYMNTCLQILAHIPQMEKIFKVFEKHSKKELLETQLFEQWILLYKNMHTQPLRVIQPSQFVSTLQHVAKEKHCELFTGWMQNDTSEFLLFMVDCMHKSIARPIKMTITGKTETFRDELAIKCYKMLKTTYNNEYSEVTELLYGISITTLASCKTTEFYSIIPEQFFIIDLPIVGTTLDSCFDNYTNSETLDGENAWFNEKTGNYESVFRNVIFWNLPDILVITLNRYTQHQHHKLQTMVEFPIDHLDLSQYIDGYNPSQYVYELFGICNHMGGMLGGHYTAFVKASSGLWFHYNDSVVEKVVDPSRMVSPNAYCLFYRKKYT